MAVEMLYDANVTVNAVVLSDHAKKVTVNYSAAALDHTTMGQDTKRNFSGLKEWSIDIDFEQDYAGGSVDATLFGLIGAAAFTLVVKNKTGGTTYTGTAILESYSPISGSVGDLQVITARFLCAGTLVKS